MTTNFGLVSAMNEAFGNPKGDVRDLLPQEDAPEGEVHYNKTAWDKIRNQCLSVGHEFVELLESLGADSTSRSEILKAIKSVHFPYATNLKQVRDSLTDVNVFSYGAHHLMGIDADRDMVSVIEGVMTRFVKDPADMQASIDKHVAKGVTSWYVEGEYPRAILKSGGDHPDAPKGKFLKSASYREPVFYDVTREQRDPSEPEWIGGNHPASKQTIGAEDVGNMEKLFKDGSLGAAVAQASGLTD